jgi:UDP-glucose 4-epimerase
MLKAVARHRRPLLLTSTSEVYGLSTDVPFREDGALVFGATSKSRWSYACSKALDEFLALGYARHRGCAIVVVRLFNTVGPRQSGRYGMVLPRFVRQAINGEPMTVHGSGTQMRCFGYVRDIVPALARLLDTPEARGNVFNLGSQSEISIRGLAEVVRDVVGSTSPIVTVPYAEAYGEGYEDMTVRLPDITRARAAVGFAPETSLRDIVGAVVAWERQRGATE